MKYSQDKYYKYFTIDEVRKLIAKRYDKKENSYSLKRRLFIHKSNCNYESAGCLFFALNGSPPKGYGLYVPDHKYLLIIDAFGKVTKYNNCILTDDNGREIDINKYKEVEILK